MHWSPPGLNPCDVFSITMDVRISKLEMTQRLSGYKCIVKVNEVTYKSITLITCWGRIEAGVGICGPGYGVMVMWTRPPPVLQNQPPNVIYRYYIGFFNCSPLTVF